MENAREYHLVGQHRRGYKQKCCFTALDAEQLATHLIRHRHRHRHRLTAVVRLAGCPCFSVCFRPADQWNKGHGHRVPHLEVMWSFAAFGHENKHLRLEGITHRNHHPPAGLQLVYQRGRNVVSGGRHDDAVKRPFFGPTEVTVAHAHLDIFVAETIQPAACGRPQWLDDFDGIHLCNQR